jgi:hypothetical protein
MIELNSPINYLNLEGKLSLEKALRGIFNFNYSEENRNAGVYPLYLYNRYGGSMSLKINSETDNTSLTAKTYAGKNYTIDLWEKKG